MSSPQLVSVASGRHGGNRPSPPRQDSAESQQGAPPSPVGGGLRHTTSSGTSTSVRSSAGANTLNFFRSVIGQRNNDYRSDVQVETPTAGANSNRAIYSARRAVLKRGSSQNSSGRAGQQQQQQNEAGGAYQQSGGLSCWQRIWYCACCQGANFVCWQGRTELFSSMIHSRLWRMISIFFTLVLLFGAEFRFLILPRRADPAMDGLFLTAFCFFCLDILMRMDCEANYFYFSLFCSQQRALRRQQRHQQQQHAHHGHHHHHHGGNNNNVAAASTSAVGCGGCQFGSFLFYADVISTLTLLYEISFINKRYFATGTIHINLDAFGIPEGGLDAVNDPTPVEFTSELLVTIAKTARVARFIRSTTAVKISSKVNWYWFLNLLNPLWWFRTCCCCFKNRRAAAAAEQAAAAAAAAANASAGMDPSNNNSSSLRAAHVLRRASWGGIITAAKLKRTKQQQLNAANNNGGNNGNGNQKKSLWGLPMRILRYLGGRTEDEEWRQELAAAKIQRAWRTVLAAREKAAESTSQEQNNHNNVAWQDRGKQGAHVTASAAERAFRKRSFLSNYANTNNRGLRASSLGRKTTAQGGGGGGGDASSPGGGGSVGDAGSNKDGSFSRRMMPGGGGAAVAANKRTRQESRVGSAMRELTGQRVAIGIIVTLVLTVLFTYKENSATRPSTMIVLHNQTGNAFFADASLNAARSSSVPDLYRYQFADGQVRDFNLTNGEHQTGLRSREILNISVTGKDGQRTWGLFAYEREKKEEALVSLLSTIFILLVWFFGLTAFAGPVMILVVTPIERMVRLLGMLMLDPLGYQRTSRYKRFVAEEDEITKNTRWTKEVLKGMETSFLMSTILRIGSLMKVGFGSAGVEIIRNNLEKGQSKNMLILSSQGSTVSCIFLFCDIRQFTDATECLQEEVFVFTNRIAGVVHSICHSRGGSANKNIGDAFLVSWLLDEDESGGRGGGGGGDFCAKNHQADKAMLTVVEISIALQHDEYYIETMSSHAREALLAKLSKRKGPVVQMGFGLHAGKAVQGAIGSQRKIDATYVSEEVEKAEFLESSTKKYGVKMLMSDSFHRLLHPSNRCRCRKVDQIVLADDDDNDDDDDEDYMSGDIMELLTFDMDIEALWRKSPSTPKGAGAAGATSGGGDGTETAGGGGDASEKAGGGGGALPDQKKSSSKRNLYDRASAGGPPAHAAAAAAVAAKRTALNKGKRMSISMSMRGGNKDKDNKEFNTSDELSDGAFVAGAAGGTAAAGAGGATAAGGDGGDNKAAAGAAAGGGGGGAGGAGAGDDGPPELKLPTGPVMYESRVWVEGNMRKIRQLYSDGLFFRKFNTGLQAFYGKDWDEARACFAGILERFEDGPSRYFMNQIEYHGGKPPRDFRGYGKG